MSQQKKGKVLVISPPKTKRRNSEANENPSTNLKLGAKITIHQEDFWHNTCFVGVMLVFLCAE